MLIEFYLLMRKAARENLSRKISALIFLLFSVVGLFGQSITGKVIDESGEPIIGALIAEVGTENGTATDENGIYKIELKSPGSVLSFTYAGYETLTETPNGRTEINVTLIPSISALDEVIVTGYLPTKRKDVLGAVVSLKAEELQQVTPVSAFDAIQGRAAGVQILNNGGPGEGFDIQIRGLSTFSGGGGPLFVVDGQQLDNINNLDPNDFASIEILKDASTAAIYGSRAANGVVMITTKSGQIGKPVIELSQTMTFQNLTSGVPLANTVERLVYERARQATAPTTVLDSTNVLYGISNDLQSLLIQQGQRSITNLSISGGNGGTRYFWNTGYLDQKGIIVNSGYKRLNTTLRLDNTFSSKVKASTRLTATSENKGGLNENTVFQQMVERIPFFPIFEPDGTLTVEIAGRQNPLAEALFTTRDTRNYRFQLFNNFEYNVLPSLTYKFNVGANLRLEKMNNFDPTIVQTVGRPATGNESQELSNDYQLEHLMLFKKSINKVHNFNAVGGYTFQKWTQEYSNIAVNAFVSDNIETINNALELNTGNTLTNEESRALSGLFGNVQYDYRGKYLVSGLIRRDGSSRFGTNKKYGIFPSYSVGWRVSNEPFMQNISNIISNLLVRAGFGTVGNDRIGNYSSRLLYGPGAFYGGVNGVSPTQLGNLDLGWESTKTKNFAVDMSLWKGRIETSVDVWSKQTSDLLYRVPIPAETGFTSIFQNIGGIQNNGIDITLGGTPLRTKDFSWRTDFNITFLKNKVTELADPDGFESGNSGEITYQVKVGQPLGSMLTYVNNGVFRYKESNAFSLDGKQLTPVFDATGKFQKYQLNGADYAGEVKSLKLASGNITLGAGDIWWKDLNNDFSIDAENDRQITGNGLANKFGGWNNQFTYKGIGLSFLLDYTFGGNIFRLYDQRRNDLNSANETPSPDRINKAWFKPGDVAEYASLDRNLVQNRLPNSAYVDKADFIKFRNLRLSYSLPTGIIKSLRVLQSLTLNASVNNWLTFTNYTGYNPELGTRGNPVQPGLDGLRYPNSREVLFSANVKF
jgi:TonB-dependent starch-binding outer membrane protein SusC